MGEIREIIGNTTATPNPRSDWAQTDPTKADFIKNKPSLDEFATKNDVAEEIEDNIPTKTSELENDSGFITSTNNSIVSSANNTIGKNNFKINNTIVVGTNNRVAQSRTVENTAIFGADHIVERPGCLIAGIGHQTSADYQTMLGYKSTYDTGAILIVGNNGNVLTAGRAGTRSDVATDAVTVDYLNNGIGADVSDLERRLNALADSDDETLDQMSEIVSYIKDNKDLIEGVTTNKVNVSDIVDNLTTNATDKPLSAAQGVALKNLINNFSGGGSIEGIAAGQGNKSLVFMSNEDNEPPIATGDYAMAIGSDDKASLAGALGEMAVQAINVEKPKAAGTSSIAFNGGAETISSGGISVGPLTTTGVKGYYWENYGSSADGYCFRLARTRKNFYTSLSGILLSGAIAAIEGAVEGFKVVTETEYVDPTTTGWEVGDTLTFVNDNQYVACAKITYINNTHIYIDTVPFTGSNYSPISVAGQEIYMFKPDDKTVFACYKKTEVDESVGSYSLTNERWYPRNGEIELGWVATSTGIENLATGSGSVVGGFNNWQGGNFGATFGRDNIGGYGNLVGGGWNESTGLHSGLVGRKLTNHGDYNFMTNQGNTIENGSHNIVGGENNELTNVSRSVVAGSNNTVGKGEFGFENGVIVGGTNKVAQSKPVYDTAIFGSNHYVERPGCLIAGTGHRTSADYQTMLGYNSVYDSGAALIIGNDGKNSITVGRDGTRSNVSTDAVTVDYLDKNIKNAIPTKTSDLTNDSGFITESSLPTKTSELTNDSRFITLNDLPDIPVNLSDLADDDTHRVVSDIEKSVWNAKANVSDIPKTVSQLTNDSGFITSFTETDPTVPAWAKAANKPTYTASEVGALPDTTTIPTKTSQLTNDSGYITSESLRTETWTFVLEDGSTVTKAVYVG